MNDRYAILIVVAAFYFLFSIYLFVSIMGCAERNDWTYKLGKPRIFLTCLLWPKWMFKKQ